MKSFPIPVVALGPGSMPEDEELDFIRMPQGMSTFQMPATPTISDPAALAEARAFLRRVVELARGHRFGGDTVLQIPVEDLSPRALATVNEALGEGEVGAIIDEPSVKLQETGFPGFWRIRTFDDAGALVADAIEVAPVPAVIPESALLGSRCRMPKHPLVDGVVNAPSILTELVDASARGVQPQAHVVNLTLLPVTPEDISWLVGALEVGPVTMLSRGYGNCRITSTRLRHTWWVQYFNSMDHLILNTIEVTPVPEVALAAPEDFADSVERLAEWMAALQ
jgi:hydrogenase-1 operon protein HyaF